MSTTAANNPSALLVMGTTPFVKENLLKSPIKRGLRLSRNSYGLSTTLTWVVSADLNIISRVRA
jgi:hypothetical protein